MCTAAWMFNFIKQSSDISATIFWLYYSSTSYSQLYLYLNLQVTVLNMQPIFEVLVNGVRKRHHSLTDLSEYLHTICIAQGQNHQIKNGEVGSVMTMIRTIFQFVYTCVHLRFVI